MEWLLFGSVFVLGFFIPELANAMGGGNTKIPHMCNVLIGLACVMWAIWFVYSK
jgi:hypothetical protein